MKNKELKDCVELIRMKCPHEKGLELVGGCRAYEHCLECWSEALNSEVNKDKLEDEIDLDADVGI